MNTWRSLALVALALAACGKTEDTDTTDTAAGDSDSSADTTPAGSDTFDSAAGGGLASIDAISISAEFGYDAATMSAVPASFDGTALNPTITFNLGEAGFFTQGDEDLGCSVFATAAGGGSMAPFATEAGILFGFEVPGPFTIDASGCEGIVDVAEAEAIVGELTADGFLWGLGIQEDLGADAEDAITGAGVDLDGFIGGGFAGSWVDPEAAAVAAANYAPDGGYVNGIEFDGTNVVLNAGQATQLMTADMIVGGELQTGYYIVAEVYYYTFQ
jgi:hypothetical protein